jgi:hippurate hydrolase
MTTPDRRSLIATIAEEATLWRRELHRHPQTMYEETFAAALIARHLTAWGIPHETGIATTGIVATIDGATTQGPTLAFRADMDALDMPEQSGVPWASLTPGKMHGCGHDGHMATVLALGKYLHQTRRFHGRVRLVFQPAEEGGRGAVRMLEEGLLNRFPFDEIYGFHNWPYGPLGDFSICPGYMMAATDFFDIHLSGRGGHAALPNVCDDLILAASHLVTALQTLVSRETDPLDSAVLSITNFQSGSGACNVLPETAHLSGTVRTFAPATRERIARRMREMIAHTAAMFNLQHTFAVHQITDAVFNHDLGTQICRDTVTRLFGPDRLKLARPVTGGEDFGSFLEKTSGAFIFAGQGTPDDPTSPNSQGLHTPRYDFNDALIPLAVEYFAEIAETRLAAAVQ